MALNQDEIPQTARQVIWKYWSTTDNTLEKDFYVALQAVVANTIREQMMKSSQRRLWVGREIQIRISSYELRARVTTLEPLLANTFDQSTSYMAQYLERPKDEHQDISVFIAEVIRYPNEQQEKIYSGLVGLNDTKSSMERTLSILLNQQYIDDWIQRYYSTSFPASLVQTLRSRYPLIILEGAVGSGKTALARSIGSKIAKDAKTSMALFIVNSQVRGGGHVGELTQNISRAFDEAERCHEQEQIPVLMLIDEADALAQSRGTRQTHHEDDAGVNTLIQRIDRLRGLPIVVLFCTNLLDALDSALLRRASASFHFSRPNFEQRASLFRYLLGPMNIANPELLAGATRPRSHPVDDGLFHRYTYSDISQRIIPLAVEKAIGQRKPLHLLYVQEACKEVLSTPEEVGGIPQAYLRDYAEYFERGFDFSPFEAGAEIVHTN